jgi:hypothetical protein
MKAHPRPCWHGAADAAPKIDVRYWAIADVRPGDSALRVAAIYVSIVGWHCFPAGSIASAASSDMLAPSYAWTE